MNLATTSPSHELTELELLAMPRAQLIYLALLVFAWIVHLVMELVRQPDTAIMEAIASGIIIAIFAGFVVTRALARVHLSIDRSKGIVCISRIWWPWPINVRQVRLSEIQAIECSFWHQRLQLKLRNGSTVPVDFNGSTHWIYGFAKRRRLEAFLRANSAPRS